MLNFFRTVYGFVGFVAGATGIAMSLVIPRDVPALLTCGFAFVVFAIMLVGLGATFNAAVPSDPGSADRAPRERPRPSRP